MKIRGVIAITVALMGSWSLSAQAGTDQATLKAASLAATCASCHGTNGAGVDGAAVPGLSHLNSEQITQAMKAFASGERTATVMHQIAKGYTDEQIQLIADYLGKK